VNVWGLNPGFFALLINVAVCAGVALVWPKTKPAAIAAGSA